MQASAFEKVINEIIKFRNKRDWLQYHDPKSLSQGISIEAAELQEIFLWMTTEDSKTLTDQKLQMAKHEMADIFIFLAYMCNHFNIDLLDAVKKKLKINDMKYPVDKCKGSNRKYDEFV